MSEEPEWMREMSPRERATHEWMHKRTELDYLTILSERPDVSFGEYDNTKVLFDMVRRGLIRWRDDKKSVHTSMFTTLYPELTDLGRNALTTSQL